MAYAGKVATPPGKPLMIFDGDCRFCTLWICRWNQMTGGKVDYIPFQNESVAKKFPELSRAQFESTVHLIETDGNICRGAEAAFRALAHNNRQCWLLRLYKKSCCFAKLCEAAYRFVARHRVFFSWLTRFFFRGATML